eukprot:s5807_g12.t1
MSLYCQAPDEATHELRIADKLNKLMRVTAKFASKAVIAKSRTSGSGRIQVGSDLRHNVSAVGDSLEVPARPPREATKSLCWEPCSVRKRRKG